MHILCNCSHYPVLTFTFRQRDVPTSADILVKNVLMVRVGDVPMLVCQCESINGENARERTQQKMDQEKLIEIVKFHESLYVMNDAKYSDTVYKENV